MGLFEEFGRRSTLLPFGRGTMAERVVTGLRQLDLHCESQLVVGRKLRALADGDRSGRRDTDRVRSRRCSRGEDDRQHPVAGPLNSRCARIRT